MNSLPKHKKLKRGANPQPQSPKNCEKKKKKPNLSNPLCTRWLEIEEKEQGVAGWSVVGVGGLRFRPKILEFPVGGRHLAWRVVDGRRPLRHVRQAIAPAPSTSPELPTLLQLLSPHPPELPTPPCPSVAWSSKNCST